MNNYFGLGRVDTSTDTKFKNKHNLTKNTESSTCSKYVG